MVHNTVVHLSQSYQPPLDKTKSHPKFHLKIFNKLFYSKMCHNTEENSVTIKCLKTFRTKNKTKKLAL